MASDPLVETYLYHASGARRTFKYDVFIPCNDEPEYLVEALRDTAAGVLNAPVINCLFNGGSIKASHSVIGMRATTDMVMVLDADLAIDKGPFKMFPTDVIGDEDQYVHLWYVRNPINGLEYGHGGPKLFNSADLSGAAGLSGVDMTTAFDKGLVLHTECVGTHSFNWSAESTWRTAFREAAKLKKLIACCKDDLEREEALERLTTWTSVADPDARFGEFCINGARAGEAFAIDSTSSLVAINDYEWLHTEFHQRFPTDY